MILDDDYNTVEPRLFELIEEGIRYFGSENSYFLIFYFMCVCISKNTNNNNY